MAAGIREGQTWLGRCSDAGRDSVGTVMAVAGVREMLKMLAELRGWIGCGE